jgi:hypothetical protein
MRKLVNANSLLLDTGIANVEGYSKPLFMD